MAPLPSISHTRPRATTRRATEEVGKCEGHRWSRKSVRGISTYGGWTNTYAPRGFNEPKNEGSRMNLLFKRVIFRLNKKPNPSTSERTNQTELSKQINRKLQQGTSFGVRASKTWTHWMFMGTGKRCLEQVWVVKSLRGWKGFFWMYHTAVVRRYCYIFDCNLRYRNHMCTPRTNNIEAAFAWLFFNFHMYDIGMLKIWKALC